MSRIYFAIVNRGKANAVLKLAKEHGVNDASVLLGEGTIRSKVLEPLGLNQTQKEIVMMPVTIEQDEILHQVISKKFAFNEKNKGIGFSVPFLHWTPDTKDFALETDEFEYSLVMAIVDKGKSDQVIKAARKAKARGGTVITGRGAAIPKDYYFPIDFEPQKDTVLVVINNKKKEAVESNIAKVIKETQDGIVFSLPVVSTSGIFEERIEEKINKIKEVRHDSI